MCLWIFQLCQSRLNFLKLRREPDNFVFDLVTPADERRKQFVVEFQFPVY
jgi:hypothetical protein